MTRITSPPRQLLTISEAAELLATTPRHVRYLLDCRELGHHKVGRYVRIDAADIDEYLRVRRVEKQQ